MSDRFKLIEGGVVDLKAARDITGLSRSGLYNLMNAGRLPFVTLGRRRMIPRNALLSLLEKNLTVAAAS